MAVCGREPGGKLDWIPGLGRKGSHSALQTAFFGYGMGSRGKALFMAMDNTLHFFSIGVLYGKHPVYFCFRLPWD